MREGLREVADLAAEARVVLLREQADVVGEAGEPVEQLVRLVVAADQREAVGQPERAGQERPLAGWQAVVGLRGVVAQHEAVPHELALDRLHRADDALVVRRQEADDGDHQRRRVQPARAVGLGERAALGVEPALAHLAVDPRAQLAPAVGGPVLHREALDGADRAVERDPGHDLGVDEVAALAADLPDPLVRLVPRALEEVEERELQPPGRLLGGQPALAPLEHRVHQLAEHVELELVGGGVADPHGRRALVAGQPVELELGQPPLARGPVHDLHLGGRAGDGAQQPVAPGLRLVHVARVHERLERQRRVAHPAEAVVPVAHAADRLRQRRGRRRDDAAGRPVGQRLQRDQAALDEAGVAAADAGARRPLLPPLRRVLRRGEPVDGRGLRLVRRVPGEDERHLVAGLQLELGDRGEVAAARRPAGDEVDRVRPGDRGEAAVGRPAHPGHDAAEVEAQDELHAHRDAALQAARDADDVGRLVADRHRVDDLQHAPGGVEVGLEHERAVAVAALRARHLGGGREQPAAVGLVAEQRGEAGGRVEPREAQPVDRAVAAHQRRGLRVADQGVVLDPQRHDGCGARAPPRASRRAGGAPPASAAPRARRAAARAPARRARARPSRTPPPARA